MSYQIIQGQTGYVDPSTSILDTGWTVDGVQASHVPCNPGIMLCLNDFGLIVGRAYIFKYTVSNYVSGNVNIIAGTTAGASYSANGTYSQQLTIAGNVYLSFYSNGQLNISSLSFYDAVTGIQAGQTVSFNEKEEKWVSEFSRVPEVYTRFIDKLFTFNNGSLWQENVNPVMNNFYGGAVFIAGCIHLQ